MKKTIFCKEPIEITRKKFDKINELMKVDFNDADMPQMERLIYMLDARPITIYASFAWEFEDGTRIIMDVESNYYEYMVRSVWENSIFDKSGYFETEYQVYPCMGFEIEGNTYICQFEIIDEEIQEEATMKKYSIGVIYTMYGNVVVEAHSEKEALKKAHRSDFSLDNFYNVCRYGDGCEIDEESVEEIG